MEISYSNQFCSILVLILHPSPWYHGIHMCIKHHDYYLKMKKSLNARAKGQNSQSQKSELNVGTGLTGVT